MRTTSEHSDQTERSSKRGRPRIVLDQAIKDALGTASDRVIADRFGMKATWVRHQRQLHNIRPHVRRNAVTLPASKPDKRHRVIDQDILDAFGTAPDQQIADRFGTTCNWVRKNRQRLKIDPYKGNQITPVLEQNPDVLALLGKESDRSLAKRFGGSFQLYRQLRAARGIPRFNDEQAQADSALWEMNRAEATALLGKVPDSELARRFGGFQCRYGYLRKKAGIPPFKKSKVTTR